MSLRCRACLLCRTAIKILSQLISLMSWLPLPKGGKLFNSRISITRTNKSASIGKINIRSFKQIWSGKKKKKKKQARRDGKMEWGMREWNEKATESDGMNELSSRINVWMRNCAQIRECSTLSECEWQCEYVYECECAFCLHLKALKSFFLWINVNEVVWNQL